MRIPHLSYEARLGMAFILIVMCPTFAAIFVSLWLVQNVAYSTALLMAVAAFALGLIAHFSMIFLAKTFPSQLLLFGAIFTCWSFGLMIVMVYKVWLLFAIVGVAAGIIALGGAYRIDRRRASSDSEDGSVGE